MKKITNILAFFFSWIILGQTTPNVTTLTDTTNIKIGEQLTYSIAAYNGKNVVFPKLKLKGLEVAEELPVDTIKNQLLKKYLITGFDSGAFYIPKHQVYVDAKAYFTDSLLVNVATMEIDSLQIQQSLATKNVIGDEYTFYEWLYMNRIYLYVLLGIVITLSVLYFALDVFKSPEKRKAKKIVPPYIIATKELEALQEKDLWQNNKVKEYYSELTDIVRKYLGDELKMQALETTTDELISSLSSENKVQELGLEKEIIDKLQALLSQADFVKFAKQKPLESEIKGHQSDAALIINTVHEIVESKKTEEQDEEQ